MASDLFEYNGYSTKIKDSSTITISRKLLFLEFNSCVTFCTNPLYQSSVPPENQPQRTFCYSFNVSHFQTFMPLPRFICLECPSLVFLFETHLLQKTIKCHHFCKALPGCPREPCVFFFGLPEYIYSPLLQMLSTHYS